MITVRALVVAGSLAVMTMAPAARQLSLEYDIKAAFVLNFVRYVEWPASHRAPPLRVCVLQTNPFGPRLDAVVDGERWHGGAIEVQVVPEMKQTAACHLLYVPEDAAARFSKGISVVAGVPILTVGEHERFLEEGGMIRLFLQDNKVRFSINQRAADNAGLLVSSRLLRLARTVIGASGPS